MLSRSLFDVLRKLLRLDGMIDEAPLLCSLTANAIRICAKHIGVVAANLALVRQASQSTRSGQNAQQRQLRQADCGGAVVHEDDLVASQSQLVTASGRRAITSSENLHPGISARTFPPIPRFLP